MKQSIIIIVIAALVILGFYIFNKNSVPTNLEQANVSDVINNSEEKENIDLAQIPAIKNLKFNFVGYGPAGKSHGGTFNEYSIAGNVFTIKTASVNADAGEMSDKLNGHLCSADFFNCAVYPEITFTAFNVSKNSDAEYEVLGSLKFRDVTKEVSFKVSTNNGVNFASDFLLDTSEFNFDPKFVTKEVRIQFSFEI